MTYRKSFRLNKFALYSNVLKVVGSACSTGQLTFTGEICPNFLFFSMLCFCWQKRFEHLAEITYAIKITSTLCIVIDI